MRVERVEGIARERRGARAGADHGGAGRLSLRKVIPAARVCARMLPRGLLTPP